MLAADTIDVSYGRVQALFGMSITVARGELVALLGANGAGKTTTLRALSGLIGVRSGRITIDDQVLTTTSAERFSSLGVAHIPEGRGTFARLTVQQNLLMGLYPRRRDKPDRTSEIERALEIFPALRERLGQRAGSLSGGEQQMLAVARALMTRPSYLLVDEPSHGLAPNIVADLFDLFERLRNEGLGILVVEQYVSLALRSAERAYVLERGQVTFEGPATDLVEDRDRLAEAYLGTGREVGT
jgi:branched-chain amino acid transport system ATP-binding protein